MNNLQFISDIYGDFEEIFEEKSIKTEKKKLKNILSQLETLPKYDTSRRSLNDDRRKIELELYNNGIKRILFNKKWYYLNKNNANTENKLKDLSHKFKNDDNTNKEVKRIQDKEVKKLSNNKLVKYKGDIEKSKNNIPKTVNINKNKKSELPPINDIIKNRKAYKNKNKFKFLPDKEYDVYDIVYIITPHAKLKSLYMGVEGSDAQDILDKINPQFEKADPFDGVFVLFSETLPPSFAKKGIRIFLLNENKIGKGVQIIKAYSNNGKFIAKYKVQINKIELAKKQEMPSKIAASLRIPNGPSLLEKINTKEFQEFIGKINEVYNFDDFNTDIDFVEIR